jgi:hypothetical protein
MVIENFSGRGGAARRKMTAITKQSTLVPAVYEKSVHAKQFGEVLGEVVEKFAQDIGLKPSHYEAEFRRAFRAVALEIDTRQTCRVVIGIETASITLHTYTKPLFFVDSSMATAALYKIVSDVYNVLIQTMATYSGPHLIIAEANRVHEHSQTYQGGTHYHFHGYSADKKNAGWKKFVTARGALCTSHPHRSRACSLLRLCSALHETLNKGFRIKTPRKTIH